jgi:hypothetical protein
MPYIRKKVIAPEGIIIDRYYSTKKGNDAEKKLRQIINQNFKNASNENIRVHYAASEE